MPRFALALAATIVLGGCHLLFGHTSGDAGAVDHPASLDRLLEPARDLAPDAPRFDGRTPDQLVDLRGDKALLDTLPGKDKATFPDKLPSKEKAPLFDKGLPDKAAVVPDTGSVAPGGSLLWSKQFTGTGEDQGLGIAQDSAGNIYLTGFFSGTLTTPDGSSLTSKGNQDILVASLNPSGGPRWSTSYGSTMSDRGTAVMVDSSNLVYLTATLGGQTSFSSTVLQAPGALLQHTDSGVLTHVSQLNFEPRALAPDAGGVVVSGVVQNQLPIVRHEPKAGGLVETFGVTFGSSGNAMGAGIVIDASQRLVVVGWYSGMLSLPTPRTSTNAYDLFVAAFEKSASGFPFLNAISFGGVGDQLARGVASDAAGTLAFVGETGGGINLGSTGSLPAGRAFVSSRLANGDHNWSRALGGVGSNLGAAVAIDAQGNVYVAGRVVGTSVYLGNNKSVSCYGNADLFVSSFSKTGTFRWGVHFGGVGAEAEASAIAVGPSGVAVTGHYNGTVQLGATKVASQGDDLFVLLLKP